MAKETRHARLTPRNTGRITTGFSGNQLGHAECVAIHAKIVRFISLVVRDRRPRCRLQEPRSRRFLPTTLLCLFCHDRTSNTTMETISNETAAKLMTLHDCVWQLGNTLRDCMNRLKTIKETNPELFVENEIAQAKHTLERYSKGPLFYKPHPFGWPFDAYVVRDALAKFAPNDCPPAETGYACDYARGKREQPCKICPMEGRNLTPEESEFLGHNTADHGAVCAKCWDAWRRSIF